MKNPRHIEEQLESLFARCPDLCGFAVRAEAEELFVSDIGISPQAVASLANSAAARSAFCRAVSTLGSSTPTSS